MAQVADLVSFKNFRSDIKSDRLFHSIMLINPDHEFLIDYAKSLAAEILSFGAPEPANSCEKVKKGVHPDLFVFGVDKPMDAAAAKEVVSSVQVAPYEGDRKVYILSRFDEIGPAAANKLLKTLEEPPLGVVFLLLVQNSSRVLQTILSRAQKFFLEGYGQQTVTEILKAKGVEDAELISLEADGNLGEAIKLAESANSSKMADFVLNTMEDLRLTAGLSYAIERAEEFKDNAKELLCFFATMSELILRVRAGKKPTSTYDINMAVTRLARTWNARALVLLIDAVTDGLKRLDANVSVNNVLDQFFLKILEVRRKCRVL